MTAPCPACRDQEPPREQDGFLRLYEIFNLNLPADLVVLSACRSGLGKQIRGEGLLGLTRAFMYAGAARIVVTQWNVDDEATAELMRHFYEFQFGAQRMRPAAALRRAQNAMWHKPRWRVAYVLGALSDAEFKGLDVKLRRYFERNRCGSPEDLAHDTILRGLKRLAEGQINYAENPHSYFLGIARNVLREERKKPKMEAAFEETSPGAGNPWNAVQWRILLRECLDKLDCKERDLIVRYTLDGAESAANQCGLTPNALRIRVSRIRGKIAMRLRGPADSD